MGIGLATARALAREGASVVVHGLEEDLLAAAVEAIAAAGGTASAVLADISTDEGAERLASEARSALGGVDILVNNAGILTPAAWMDATPAMWAQLYDVNVVGAVRLIRLLAQPMRDAGWGRIIQVSSTEAGSPFAVFPHYAATKAALVNLSVSLSKELARTGVTVNTVTPGIIHTEGVEGFYRGVAVQRGWGDDWETIEQNALREFLDNPVGRFGSVDEVADVIAFLASPRAAFVNGANVRIDGGGAGSVNP
jgi:NAD(P)-dependent dehydrogenase (short-subunit alcohol dehydrogenase family)